MSIIFRDDMSSDPEGQSPPTRGTVGGDDCSSMDDDSLIQKSFDINVDDKHEEGATSGDGSPNARDHGSDKENASPPRPQFGNVSQCLKSGGIGAGGNEACRDSFLDLEQQMMVDGGMAANNNNNMVFPSSKISSSSSASAGGHQPKMIFSPEKTPSTPSLSSPFLHASDHGSIADFNLGSPGHHLAHMGGGRTSFDNDGSEDNNNIINSSSTSRRSINFFDPIQSSGLVSYSDITSFMEEQCGTSSSPPSASALPGGTRGKKQRSARSGTTNNSTASATTARTTFHVLDYLMVLHQVAPEFVDLSAICWSTNPVRSQLEQNAKIFVDAAEKISSKFGVPSITDSYLIKFGDSSDSSPTSTDNSTASSADPHKFVIPAFEPVAAHNDIFLKYQREAALESSPTNFLSSPEGDDDQYKYAGGVEGTNTTNDDDAAAPGAGLHGVVITALVDSTVDPGGVHLALQSWLYRADKTLQSLATSSSTDEAVPHRPVASDIRSAAMRKYCHTQAPLRAMFEQGYNEAAQNLVMTAHGRIKEAQASAAADAAKLQAQKAESAATKSRFALVPNCASRPHRSTTPPVTGVKRDRGASSTGNTLPPSRKPPIPEAARRSGGSTTDPNSKTVEDDATAPNSASFVLTAAPFPNLSDLSRPRYTLEQQVSDACMVQVFAEALEDQIHQTTLKFYSVLGESDPANRERLWKEVTATASKDASEFVAPRMKL